MKLYRVAIALGLVSLLAFFVQSAMRVPYEFEIEWMEGGMLTHAARLLEGQQIYAPPSTDFVPFFYTPLCPMLLAGLSFLTGGLSFTMARLVSLGFTLCTFALLFHIGRRERSREVGLLAVGLYAAMFRLTGAFYDVARPDAMFIFLVLAACYTAYSVRSTRGVVGAALLFVIGHFTKQTTSVFVPMVGLWLFSQNRRHAALFLVTVFGTGALSTWAYDHHTGGWFWTYVFQGHQGHLFYWKNILMEYWRDVLFLAPVTLILPLLWFSQRFHLTALCILMAAHWGYAFVFRARTLDYQPHMYYAELWYETPRLLILVPPFIMAAMAVMAWVAIIRRPSIERKPLQTNTYWLLMYIACVGSSGLNHSTQWAYSNCFMPLAVFSALFLSLVVDDLIKTSPALTGRLVSGILVLQLVAFGYDPRSQVPTPADHEALAVFNAALDGISGRVFAPAHPFVSYQRDGVIHTHQMGIQDVAFMGGLKDLPARLRAQEWAAVIVDAPNTVPELGRYYRLDRRLDLGPNDALRAKTGFLVRPSELWVPK